ncbi:RNA-directed DNA polymerase, eukaryota [Artemisia annua]|uniref:RNA-directed DNA polymerase, eukaryota n=1 Tax=Artemisia annua TaxID=35608 RepID=A0A2U1QCL7_ARTAN|nr:RNA-directed DNA polymerase, eukaryota [Artemisia annua]
MENKQRRSRKKFSNSLRPDVQLKNKFKNTKAAIKNWYREVKHSKDNRKRDILNRLEEFDKNIESGSVEVGELHQHSEDLIQIYKPEQMNLRSLRQRAKCKWASLGDENSRLYHCYINSRRRKQLVHGISVAGTWPGLHLGALDSGGSQNINDKN